MFWTPRVGATGSAGSGRRISLCFTSGTSRSRAAVGLRFGPCRRLGLRPSLDRSGLAQHLLSLRPSILSQLRSPTMRCQHVFGRSRWIPRQCSERLLTGTDRSHWDQAGPSELRQTSLIMLRSTFSLFQASPTLTFQLTAACHTEAVQEPGVAPIPLAFPRQAPRAAGARTRPA